MKYITLILLVLFSYSQVGSIIFTNFNINTLTNATLFISRTNITTPTIGNISITFPSNSYTSSSLSSAYCNVTCLISGLTITIPVNAFTPPITSTIQFVIYNIKNPSSCILPGSYYYQMINSSGVVESINITTGGFNPGTLTSCNLTFTPNYVRKLGVATFFITPSNPIPINGSINIIFPNTWSNIVNNDVIINSSSLTCSYNGGSVLKTTLSCSPLITGQINLANIFNSSTNSTFSFTVGPILSLPTSNSQSSVLLMSMDQNGNIIDNYTLCTAIGPNPNIIPNISITNPNITVSTNFTPVITFRSTDLMNQNDVLRISNICPDIIATNMNSMTMIVTNGTFNFSNSITLQSSLTLNSSYYGYYIPKMTSLTYANSNSLIYLTNLTFTSPLTTMPQNCLNISLYRAGSIYSTGNLSITPSSNQLNNVSLISNTSIVNTKALFTISFITSSPLSSSAVILITLPSTIIITPYSIKACNNYSGNVNSGVKCTLFGQILNISSIFSGNVNGQKNITISFDGVTNPQSSMPTSNFVISTYYTYNNSYIVDQYTALNYTATSDIIQNANISINNLTVGAKSIYTINYITKNHLPINSYIIIGLPIGLSFSNTSTVSANVTVNSVTFLIYPSVINISQTFYNQAINFTSLTQSVLEAGTIIQFNISYIINPNSTAPSNSFSIFSYYKQYLVESLVNGLSIVMISAAQFTSTSITPNSAINGDLTYYLLSFQVSLDHNTPCIMSMIIPNQITLISNCTCNSLAGFTVNTNINCSVNGITLTFLLNDLSGILYASKMYTIQIIGFINPRTYTTSSLFILSTFQNNYLVNNGSINGITNNQPNNMLNFTSTVISPTQSYLNSSQTILFNLTTMNGLNTSDYLILYFPTAYSYNGNSNSSICTQINIYCIPMSSNNLAVKITGNPSFSYMKNLTFTIFGYRSPNSISFINMISYFTISSFQINNNPIDITNSNNIYTKTTFTITCNSISLCQTCNPVNLSSCLTCYPLTITNSAYFQNNSCISNCATGFYPNLNFSCTACISPCKTCMSAASCLSCYNSTMTIYISFDNTTNQCVQNCPDRYYAQPLLNYVCVSCNQICLKCNLLSNNCTTCNSSYIYYNYSCLLTCPTGTYNSSNNCSNCDVSCYSCLNSAINCFICANGYFRSGIGNLCTNTCTTGTALYNGVCQCSNICLTCNNYIYNCTSCNISSNYPYLYIILTANNTCVLNCPAGTYTNGINCTSCPQGCSLCSTSSKCSSCNGIFYYFNETCVKSCPLGYFNQANICVICISPCVTCSILATNCTSCITNYSLDGNFCTNSCSNNKIAIMNNNFSICTSCSANCSTCSITINNCTLCASIASIFKGYLCFLLCPDTFTSVNKICVSCTNPCVNCVNTTSNCLTCIPGYYLLNITNNSTCITSCPLNYYINDGACITCQSPCSTCAPNSAFNCTSCILGYLFENNLCLTNCSIKLVSYQGKCLSSCPDGYSTNNNTCMIAQSTINSKFIPVPFVIAGIILILLIFGSKFVYPQTFIPSLAISLLSLLEICSWFTILIMTKFAVVTQYKYQGISCYITGFVLHYLLNALNLYFFFKYIKNDEIFAKWYKSQANPYLNILVLILSISLNHKFFHIIFSKALSSHYLKAPLSNPAQFTPINIISGLSIIPSVLFLVGSSLVAYDVATSSSSQLFMECIDSIIITILTGLCTLWNIKKPILNNFNQEEQIKKNESHQNFMIHETLGQFGGGNDMNDNILYQDIKLEQRKQSENNLKIEEIQNQMNEQGINTKQKLEQNHKENTFQNMKIQNNIQNILNQGDISNILEIQKYHSIEFHDAGSLLLQSKQPQIREVEQKKDMKIQPVDQQKNDQQHVNVNYQQIQNLQQNDSKPDNQLHISNQIQNQFEENKNPNMNKQIHQIQLNQQINQHQSKYNQQNLVQNVNQQQMSQKKVSNRSRINDLNRIQSQTNQMRNIVDNQKINHELLIQNDILKQSVFRQQNLALEQQKNNSQQDQNLFVSKTNIEKKNQEIRVKGNEVQENENLDIKPVTNQIFDRSKIQKQQIISEQQFQQFENMQESYVRQNYISPSQYNQLNQRYDTDINNNKIQNDQDHHQIVNNQKLLKFGKKELLPETNQMIISHTKKSSIKYDGVYIKLTDIQASNNKNDLEKIYLQRIDGKNSIHKRKSTKIRKNIEN